MIPPSPLPFPLWGPSLYAEFTAGLWRALAAPWLAPGRPPYPTAPGRPSIGPGDSGTAPLGKTLARQTDASAAPAAAAPAPRGQLIEVPRARWQRHRKPAQ